MRPIHSRHMLLGPVILVLIAGAVRGNEIYTIKGSYDNPHFGYAVSGVGDVNVDGYADVIIGCPTGRKPGGQRNGSAWVMSGKDRTVLYEFYGESYQDRLGESVSGAGDVNADGYDDFIVGIRDTDVNGTDSGSARVYSGKDGTTLYTFHGDAASDFMGESVSGAGDVNADGFDDLIVGIRGADPNGAMSGRARVFSGKDGKVLYTFNGDHYYALFGGSVSGAGDVNADGFDDLIVGAIGHGSKDEGLARVFSGKNGAVLYSFVGGVGDSIGQSVSGAGDVNADGYADFVVGCPWYNVAYDDQPGAAQVFSGKDGSLLYLFVGDSKKDQFGYSVSDAGDVNGDGFADVIAGAKYDDNSGLESGSARVHSGKDGAILLTVYGDSPKDYFGNSVSGAGDVNGDGFADVVAGSVGDPITSSPGWTRVYSSVCGLTAAYGSGCPGSGAFAPVLSFSGCSTPCATLTLEMSKGAAGANAFLFLGLQKGAAPMGAGCFLNIQPVVGMVGPVPLSPGGSISLPAVIPPGTPWAMLTIQGFVIDPGAPLGFAATNGVLITIA